MWFVKHKTPLRESPFPAIAGICQIFSKKVATVSHLHKLQAIVERSKNRARGFDFSHTIPSRLEADLKALLAREHVGLETVPDQHQTLLSAFPQTPQGERRKHMTLLTITPTQREPTSGPVFFGIGATTKHPTTGCSESDLE